MTAWALGLMLGGLFLLLISAHTQDEVLLATAFIAALGGLGLIVAQALVDDHRYTEAVDKATKACGYRRALTYRPSDDDGHTLVYQCAGQSRTAVIRY